MPSPGSNGGNGSPLPLRLALELRGAGHHPAAWRHLAPAGVDPASLLTLGYTRGIALAAEAAGFDLLIIDDSLAPADEEPNEASGRLDALTVAAALGPLTTTIGLAPVVTTTHTEPFHVAKNLQSLDWVSRGRAAWKPAVSTTAAEARAFGRRGTADLDELWAEAADVVEVARRLWDSWEDDAIIRHAPTGRFIDRTRLHYIDFESERFSVRGPSITPRSPQAQPPIVIELVAGSTPGPALDLAAREGDVVVLRGADVHALADLRAALDRQLQSGTRSQPTAPLVLAVVDVLLDTPGGPGTTAGTATAAERRAALDADAPAAIPSPDALRYDGAGAGLVDAFERWRAAASLDGFVVRPAVVPVDLAAFAATVSPLLPAPPGAPLTLRDRFGWPRPANRYAAPPTPTAASPTAASPAATAP